MIHPFRIGDLQFDVAVIDSFDQSACRLRPKIKRFTDRLPSERATGIELMLILCLLQMLFGGEFPNTDMAVLAEQDSKAFANPTEPIRNGEANADVPCFLSNFTSGGCSIPCTGCFNHRLPPRVPVQSESMNDSESEKSSG